MEFALEIVFLAGISHILFIILICWWSCRKEGPCAKKNRRQRQLRRLERRLQREAAQAEQAEQAATENNQPINAVNNPETSELVTQSTDQSESNGPDSTQPGFLTETWISSLAARISRVGVRVGTADRAEGNSPSGRRAQGHNININIEIDDSLPHYEEAVLMQVSRDEARMFMRGNAGDVTPPPSYEDVVK